MKPGAVRTIRGPFSIVDLGASTWCLTRVAPPRCDIYLRGVKADADEILTKRQVDFLAMDWRIDGVGVTLGAQRTSPALLVDAAIVHETAPGVLDSLPLSVFDAAARRFWRRVFLLVRLPGGRRLLSYMTWRRRL